MRLMLDLWDPHREQPRFYIHLTAPDYYVAAAIAILCEVYHGAELIELTEPPDPNCN